MSETRIRERFALLRPETGSHSGTLIPYFTSGFPSPGVTEVLITRADALGVVAVEIGIPYSDSIADGPVIQDSYHDVLERGYRLEDTFDLVSRVRSKVSCGLIAMVSYSIVHRSGVAAFLDRAARAGFDGLIVPDVPIEESSTLASATSDAELCYVGLVAPTTTRARTEAIARESTGFIYQIAVAGTTGERSSLPDSLPEQVRQLRAVSGLPVCVGFGVSSAEQVRAVCEFADGAIVGSAIIRRLAAGVREGLKPEQLADSVSAFLAELMTGACSVNPLDEG